MGSKTRSCSLTYSCTEKSLLNLILWFVHNFMITWELHIWTLFLFHFSVTIIYFNHLPCMVTFLLPWKPAFLQCIDLIWIDFQPAWRKTTFDYIRLILWITESNLKLSLKNGATKVWACVSFPKACIFILRIFWSLDLVAFTHTCIYTIWCCGTLVKCGIVRQYCIQSHITL